MGSSTEVSIRVAEAADAPAIARLHADSWRRHYRGAYSDSYLDGNLDADRVAVWSDRLNHSDGGRFTLLAERETHPVGFVHVVLDADPTWGSLIDNLHVTSSLQGNGIGTRLLDASARRVISRRPGSPIFLWVLEQNRAAQAFYASRGGTICGRELVEPPRGDSRNLAGTPMGLRVAWQDPALLLLVA